MPNTPTPPTPDPTLELIADCHCAVGENPLWRPTDGCLYWVDIPPGHIYRYDPRSGAHAIVLDAGVAIGGFTFEADGAFLLFMARGMICRWAGRGGPATFETIIDEIPDERPYRFNDVIADPVGRVFCGTIADVPRRLYRLDRDRTITPLVEGVLGSNGLGFTPDRRGLYYADSRGSTISLFDYDQATGAITNRRLFAQPPVEEGLPDGLTVDRAGGIWSARWNGGALVRYHPDGSVDRRVAIPSHKVTSAIFGGDDYRDLYITTAAQDADLTATPGAGSVYRLRPEIGGVPEFPSRIGI